MSRRWQFLVGAVLLGALAAWALWTARLPRGRGTASTGLGARVGSGAPLVIVHSYMGHTAAIGQEFARLLGGRFASFDTPPPGYPVPPGTGAAPPSSASLQVDRAGLVFLGFPVWGSGPSQPFMRFVQTLDLKGKTVVPFYTCLHSIDLPKLAQLRDLLQKKGARVLEAIGIQAPLFDDRRDLIALAREVLYQRTDLWMTQPDPAPKSDCRPHPKRPGTQLCHVTGGPVWVGIPRVSLLLPRAPLVRLMHVGAFDIDQTEVTVGEYARCVQAGQCPRIEATDRLCEPQANDPQPCVSEQMASAFCHWIGMRLPTLAEWTRAARGHTMNPYPWGTDWPGSPPRLSFTQPRTPDEGDAFANRPWLSPGCSFPGGNSPFGVCDLAGSLGEYADPGSIKTPHRRTIVVGGAFLDSRAYAFRVTSGIYFPRRIGMYVNGFRCAK